MTESSKQPVCGPAAHTDARQRAMAILDRLEPQYAGLSTGLHFSTPLELLIATILSAQCTDERVNVVTPALFSRFQSAQDFAQADQTELETLIHSCGFYRNKARHIQRAATMLVERFGGEVPRSMDELLQLPGVARKTANVVLSHAFGIDVGIAVDTHVQRLSQRLQFSVNTDPVRIEQDLLHLVPEGRWRRLSDVLIWHGRRVCAARAPACGACVVADLCPSALMRST